MVKRKVTDEEAIRRTAAEYCQFYDDRRFDDFEDIWTEDAVFHVRDIVRKGRRNIRAFIEGLVTPRNGAPAPSEAGAHAIRSHPGGMHCFFNFIIEVTGYTAGAQADYLAAGVRDGQIGLGSGGRVLLRLVKEPDRWRIADMEFRLLLAPEEYDANRQRQDAGAAYGRRA